GRAFLGGWSRSRCMATASGRSAAPSGAALLGGLAADALADLGSRSCVGGKARLRGAQPPVHLGVLPTGPVPRGVLTHHPLAEALELGAPERGGCAPQASYDAALSHRIDEEAGAGRQARVTVDDHVRGSVDVEGN